MQLFVMPVTTRLLCSDNAARCEEFPFAMEKHIPVLPLMQESNLEGLFNQKCGDLQFLDKNNTDATAASYDEKLEKYLSSVLVGDELAEKVRAAFDAYIFLSYRKKDRRYAQELMRLVHKNEFCRDIAIWYDEFLTPGENFNDAIRDALNKSGLFLLAVTPNLVNETNYVMTTEYPMARMAGKPILPAELVPTDRDALSEHYEEIPACTDAYSESDLSEAMWKAIERMAIRENDASPEHNFFIGLAYLDGIDVEVDRDRALSLITSAADAGLIEAIEKLVTMYRSGAGIERSYETAIVWQEKKVLAMEAQYRESPSEKAASAYFWALLYCGDYHRELGRLANAEKTYESALAFLEGCPYNGRLTKRNRSVGYNRLGNAEMDQGHLVEAKALYEKALETDLLLAKETGTVQARRDLSVSYNKLGSIAEAQGNLAEAKAYYEKDLEICLRLSEETGTPQAKRDLSVSYSRLGNIAKAQENLTEAKAYYEKELEIGLRLSEETGTPQAKRDLSVSYSKLGNIAKAQGNLTEAKAYYEKDLEISLLLAEEAGTIQARRDLSVSYNKLGSIAEAQENLAEAKAFYEKDLEISLLLAEEIGTVQARRDLSISYNKLGNMAEAQGNLTEAKAFYEKALEIRVRLMEETNTAEAKHDLSVSYSKLGNIAKAQGNLAEAKAYYEKDLEISLLLAEETGTIQARRDLSISYNKLGNMAEMQGNLAEAKAYYEKALEIRIRLAEETGTSKAKRELEICYANLRRIANAMGN